MTARLLAIDPSGCGCTECLSGEYKPLDQATDEDIAALLGGVLSDNTDEYFAITENTLSTQRRGFTIIATSLSWHIDTLALPIAVENYDIHLSRESFEKIMEGGGHPRVLDFD